MKYEVYNWFTIWFSLKLNQNIIFFQFHIGSRSPLRMLMKMMLNIMTLSLQVMWQWLPLVVNMRMKQSLESLNWILPCHILIGDGKISLILSRTLKEKNMGTYVPNLSLNILESLMTFLTSLKMIHHWSIRSYIYHLMLMLRRGLNSYL